MFKKMAISHNLYDVYSEEEYHRKCDINPTVMKELESSSAIQRDGYVYPVYANNVPFVSPGVKNYGIVLQYNHPQTEEEKKEYNSDNIIDFGNVTDCADMIRKTAEIQDADQSMLTKVNNITEFVEKEEDTPEFRLLKRALNQKGIDISAYKHRFSTEFSNDLRILTQCNSITFNKLRTIANAVDIDVELIMRDKPGCVNPIGEELRVKL